MTRAFYRPIYRPRPGRRPWWPWLAAFALGLLLSAMYLQGLHDGAVCAPTVHQMAQK